MDSVYLALLSFRIWFTPVRSGLSIITEKALRQNSKESKRLLSGGIDSLPVRTYCFNSTGKWAQEKS